jgi:RND family efflux transporter MFP subunit
MKRLAIVFSLALLGAAGFAGGVLYSRRSSPLPLAEARKILYYVDPMHPSYTSDKPGIAPDCGMKLEPVYAGGPPEAGAAAVQVSPDRQQLIGVSFATAEISSAAETLRAVGKVAMDETRVTRVHPRIEGWISEVNAGFIGQPVQKGDALLTLYSPEMAATEQEFLLALRARDELHASHEHDTASNSERLIDASRRRLERWNMSAAQIEELERTRTPLKSISIYAPASGVVIARNAFPNQKVGPETELYALADLTHVWIMADIFEIDLPKIRQGQAAWVTLANAAGGGFAGRVDYIQPQADPATRTVKVRINASNDDLRLKPDMFVNVDFRSGGAARVTVPADAVVNTGLRQTVFVDQGDGRLEPRAVEIGDRIDDRIQILRGLRAGERVVASGAFLVDSEAQLKGALSHDQHNH